MPSVEQEIDVPLDMFEEPKDFRPPSPKPTFLEFKRLNGQEMTLSLVGKHSLWAHRLWNAGKSMANYIDSHPEMFKGKRVLELGAGAALPSLIAALVGAQETVITDYPDPALINNIHKNVALNTPNCNVQVKGHIWGHEMEQISTEGFDIILLADIIFNHTEHKNIFKSCKALLKPNGMILTTFTHHVVKWADRDLKFFEIAPTFGFTSEKLYEERWDCMFPDDEGDVDVRSTVHCFLLKF